MLFTAQAPCYKFRIEKCTHLKKEKPAKIKLSRLKNNNRRSCKRLSKIAAISKSYDDRSKNISQVVAKLGGISEGGQIQKTT